MCIYLECSLSLRRLYVIGTLWRSQIEIYRARLNKTDYSALSRRAISSNFDKTQRLTMLAWPRIELLKLFSLIARESIPLCDSYNWYYFEWGVVVRATWNQLCFIVEPNLKLNFCRCTSDDRKISINIPEWATGQKRISRMILEPNFSTILHDLLLQNESF